MDKQIDELFGAWSAAPAPAVPAVPAMRPASRATWLTLRDPEERQVRVTLDVPAGSARAQHRGAHEILGRLINARADQVRQRFGASYGVHARYVTTAAGDYLEIDGEIDASRAGDAIHFIQDLLAGVRTGDDTLAGDFVLARRAALAHALADPIRSSSAADDIEDAITLGWPADEAQRLPGESRRPRSPTCARSSRRTSTPPTWSRW